MVNENDRFKKAPGVKSSINNIINGKFIKITDEFKPSYVVGITGKQMSRVNVIGIIISDINNNETNADFLLDDATGSVTIRTFDEKIIGKLNDFGTGNLVMIIGKPREFNDSIYIVPEIIKELKNNKWVNLRKKELSVLEDGIEIKTTTPKSHITKEESYEEPKNELDSSAMEGKSKYVESAGVEKESISKESNQKDIDYNEDSNKETKNQDTDIKETDDAVNLNSKSKANKTNFEPTENPFDKIIRIIGELDEGRGADYEGVIEKANLDKTEEIINNLLLEGEIFEISPGKLKVL